LENEFGKRGESFGLAKKVVEVKGFTLLFISPTVFLDAPARPPIKRSEFCSDRPSFVCYGLLQASPFPITERVHPARGPPEALTPAVRTLPGGFANKVDPLDMSRDEACPPEKIVAFLPFIISVKR